MKTFFSILIIMIVTSTQAQWSTDPNNNLIVGYGLDPNICSDSTGGCYVTYDYESTNYPRKLGLERIDKYGYKPWGTLKQIFGELPGQWHANITEDGEEGVIVSYQDTEINGSLITANVRVQRVDSNGNYLWGQTGVRVTMSETNQGSQELVTDGDGGCIIVWQYYDGIYSMNRINRFGQRVWGETGIDLGTSAFSERPIIVRASDGNYYVQTGEYIYRIRNNGEIVRRDSVTLGYIIPDCEGGIVLSGGVGNINNRRLVAQRKDSLGNNLWQEPYVEIADSLDIGASLNILGNKNYYYYGWLGRKNGVSEILQIQSLRNDGTKLILGGSISLSDLSTSITSIPIITSFDGSNIYAWTHWDSPQTYNANFARRIDSTGSDIWPENPVLLNEPYLGYFSMVTDCFGGAIGVGYMNSDFAIRALKVSINGNLGEVIVPVELVSFNGKVINYRVELFWQTATEVNNMGFEIERKFISHQSSVISIWERIGFVAGNGTTTEIKSYSFVDKNISSGIYKYRLKQIDFDGSFEYSNEIEIEVDFIPKEFVLHQNYPNPFNPVTTIQYDLPSASNVSLIIYDILGRKVKELINTKQQAGKYEIQFDASNLASGIYIYQLIADKFISSKKMILLK